MRASWPLLLLAIAFLAVQIFLYLFIVTDLEVIPAVYSLYESVLKALAGLSLGVGFYLIYRVTKLLRRRKAWMRAIAATISAPLMLLWVSGLGVIFLWPTDGFLCIRNEVSTVPFPEHHATLYLVRYGCIPDGYVDVRARLGWLPLTVSVATSSKYLERVDLRVINGIVVIPVRDNFVFYDLRTGRRWQQFPGPSSQPRP